MAWRETTSPTVHLDATDSLDRQHGSPVVAAYKEGEGTDGNSQEPVPHPVAQPVTTFGERHDDTDPPLSLQERMDHLQEWLDSLAPENLAGRRELLHEMMRLARTEAVFPTSMLCSGVRVDEWQPYCEGGSSYVYKGVYRGGAVAVKVLKGAVSREKEMRRICIQTALIWRQLSHCNILQCYGIADEVVISSASMVFPWLENGDLRHYIQDKVPFGGDDTFPLDALKDVARGLRYLHGQNPQIVHSDIRCENVLVKQDKTCCISDFRLSFQSSLTDREGNNPGAIRFMAPEATLSGEFDFDKNVEDSGRRAYDTPARDIYSFGCMIVEIYTAQDPFFWLRNSAQVILALSLHKCEPWTSKPTDVPGVLWDMARECWRADPDRRPGIEAVYHSLCSSQESEC